MKKGFLVAVIIVLIPFLCSCSKKDGKTGTVFSGQPLMSSALPSSLGEEPLEVVMAQPSGDVGSIEDLSSVTVTFNRPMVPITSIDNEYAGDILVFEPPVSGEYRWLGTASLMFIPAKPFTPGTSYKVVIPKSIKSLDGKSMDKDFSWRFDALRPELRGTYAWSEATVHPAEMGGFAEKLSESVKHDCEIWLYFNQPMDPVSVKKFIEFEKVDSKNNVLSSPEFTLKKLSTSGKDLSASTIKELGWTKENVIVLKPAENLDVNSFYMVLLKQGLKGKTGSLGMKYNKDKIFGTEKKFALDTSANKETVSVSGDISLKFSNPVRMKDLAAHVKFKPAAEVPAYYSESRTVNYTHSLYPDFKSDTKYTVLLDPKLKDIYGNELGETAEFSFKTGDYYPSLDLPEGNGVVESESSRVFPVKIMNVDSLELVSVPLSKERLISFASSESKRDSFFESVKKENPPVDRQFKTNALKNRETVYGLKMDEVLKTGKGLAFVGLRRPVSGNEEYAGKEKYVYYSSVVQVTNLALHAKLSPENGLVWVTSLDKGLPVADAAVEIRDASNKVVWSGKTGSDGTAGVSGFDSLAKSGADGSRPLFWVFAQKSGDTAFINTEWEWSVNSWRFDINTAYYSGEKDYKAAVFTEKGLYSPGNKVILKTFLREKKSGQWSVPREKGFFIAVNDSRGSEVYNGNIFLNEFGTAETSFELSPDSPTGSYTVRLARRISKDDSRSVDYSEFQVEDYKPADYKVKVTIPNKTYYLGDDFSASCSGRWLFDAPMKEAAVNWSIWAAPHRFAPKGYDDFSFAAEDFYTYGEEDGSVAIASGEGRLDASGTMDIKAKLSSALIQSSMKMSVEATVRSSSNSSLSDSLSVVLHKSRFYIGIKSDAFALPAGAAQKILIVALTPDAKKVANTALKTEIIKRQWYSVRKDSLGEGTSWVSEKKDEVLKSFEDNLTDGKAEINYTPEKPGYYVVRASAKDSSGSDIVSESSFYAYGNGYVAWDRNDDDTIELIRDKKSYSSGDKARIIVKSPYESAKALVTVEKDYVVEKRVVDIKGSASVLEFPVTEKDAPGMFVSVVLVQGRMTKPSSDRDTGKPSFKVGYVELPVFSEKRKLDLSIAPGKINYEPGEKASLKLKLTDSSGKGVKGEVTLAVVDTGVLSLINYDFPDLFNVFYNSNTLYVESFESRRNVIGQRNYGEKGGKNGGGGGLAGLEGRRVFKDTAYWKSSVITDSSGKAEVSFVLPDNITSFTIMAVGCTADKFSKNTKKEITVSKPLLLKSALPSFASKKDRIFGGVMVFNGTGKERNVAVSVNAAGITVDGVTEKNITIPAGGDRVVAFDFIADKQGTASVSFKAVAEGYTDELVCMLPVGISDTSLETVVSFAGSKDTVYNEQLSLPASQAAETGTLSLSLGSSIMERLRGTVEYLQDYPYMCLEQRISRVMPYLAAVELSDYCGVDEKSRKDSINSLLSSLSSYRCHDGGFSLWKDGEKSSEFLSCYAMHMITLAKKASYNVDRDIYERGQNYLAGVVNANAKYEWSGAYNEKEKTFIKTYALYILYLGGRKHEAELSLMCERTGSMDCSARAFLLNTLLLSKRNTPVVADLTKSILGHMKTEASTAFFDDSASISNIALYNSPVRTTSLVMSSLLDASGAFPNMDRVAVWLVDSMRNGRFQNTQDAAFALPALNRYFVLQEKSGNSDYFGAIRLDGKELVSGKLGIKQRQEISAQVPLSEIVNRESGIRFEKKGLGVMYCNTRLTYMPEGEISAKSRGITVFKKIEPLKKDGLQNYKSGNIYKVTLSVVTPADRSYVVLHEPVAAGFTAVNTSFVTESKLLAGLLETLRKRQTASSSFSTFDHEEFYHDKVLIFATELKKGEHVFTYLLRAETPGNYNLSPSKAFMMYHPEVFGSTNSTTLKIE